MENDILKHRKEVQENILKSFGAEVSDDLLEKAHNHGDVHSNGKWYWESSANGGKGDWRTIKGTAKPQPKAEEKKEDDENAPSMKSLNEMRPGEVVSEFKKTFPNDKFSIVSGDFPGTYIVSYFDNGQTKSGHKAVGIVEINKSKKIISLDKTMINDDIYKNTINFVKKLSSLQKYKIKFI